MANVVRETSNGDYDLKRGLGLYDTSGDLPIRARELWTHIQDSATDMAREYWRRYYRSPEVRDSADEGRIDELAEKILPFIAGKFERLDQPGWTERAHDFVEEALG